jgi:hypothetical protein
VEKFWKEPAFWRGALPVLVGVLIGLIVGLTLG